jgi:D-serine deaminase-like pyridoxal phosphate-dependent protein
MSRGQPANVNYALEDTRDVLSPGLLFYKDLIGRNIARMIEMAGGPERLRPHVKTHKTRQIVGMELAAGITRQKCATVAEAEMLAECGVPDILLAYNLVGPNCARMARLVKAFPGSRFSVLADNSAGARALSEAMARAGGKVQVLIDLDVGQHRTGIAPGAEAVALYELLARLPGLEPGGLHVYDGHNHQEFLADRKAAVVKQLEPVLALRETLKKKGLPVPRMVVGGTPTFSVYVGLNLTDHEYAPGTCVLHDHGYGTRFADLAGFTPAALLLTRVISRPTPNRVTFDLGYKAVASDPPAGKRCVLLDIPDYEAVLQNEEHLVIETPAADRFSPGDVAYAVPTHICPTCAMHKFAYVVENGRVTDQWEIVARDRVLKI